MTDKQAAELAGAVGSWLDFQCLCNRQMLLSEASLVQPIGEYLHGMQRARVELEWNHPEFAETVGRGRKCQIDFAIFSSTSLCPTAVIETKWVRSRAIQKQLLIDDALRLVALQTTSAGARYLLVAGKRLDVKTSLLDAELNTGSGERVKFLPHCLPLVANRVSVPIKKCRHYMRPFFRSFERDYGIALTTTMGVQCIADWEGEHSYVLVWRIFRQKGNASFSPRYEWPVAGQ